MPSQRDYEIARKGLEAAVDAPDAFTEEEITRLSGIVSDFQSSRKEPTSMLGPTGMDMLESKVPAQGPPETDVSSLLEKLPGAKIQFDKANPLTDFSAGNPVTASLEERKLTHDDNLPNASKRKDFSAPPEFLPPPPEAPPATNPIEAFGLKLSNARASLPGILGGKVDHVLEPSLEQFQQEMGPFVHPSELHHGSDAYKEYADGLWQKVYDQAKAENRPVVRDAFKKDQTWATKAGDFAARNVAGAAAGVDKAFGGLFSDTASVLKGKPFMDGEQENQKLLRGAQPEAALAGEIGGSMIGVSPASLAARGAGAALPKAAGLAGSMARAGAVGAAAGGAQAGAGEIAEGHDPSASGVGMGAAIGFPLAAFGSLIGFGARAHGQNLRQGSTLGQAKKAGVAETSTLFGVKPTKAAQKIRQESYAQSGEPGREVDMLADRNARQVIAGGRALENASQKEVGLAQQEFFDLSKTTKVPQTDLLKEAMRLHARGVDEHGQELFLHGPQQKILKDALKTSGDFEIVPASGGNANVRSTTGKSFDLDPDTATLQGVDVEQLMARYLRSGKEAPGDFMVRVIPRELNPDQTEQVIAKIGEYLKQGDADKTQALNSLMPFSRAAREKFPSVGPISDDITSSVKIGGQETPLKGWAAFQHEAFKKRMSVERTLGRAGLPTEGIPEEMTDAIERSVAGQTRNYGKPGRSPDLDQALRDLADPQQLEQMRGMSNLGKLEAESSMFPSMSARTSGFAGSINPRGARFHLDPMLEAIAPPLLSGRAGAAGGALSHKKKPVPTQLDPLTFQQLQTILGGRR